jgi:hypothetical protein
MHRLSYISNGQHRSGPGLLFSIFIIATGMGGVFDSLPATTFIVPDIIIPVDLMPVGEQIFGNIFTNDEDDFSHR